MKRTFGEVLQMVNGSSLWDGDGKALTIKGVSTDSRTIRPGQLFVPLVGETFDGHTYVQQALEQGAAAAFWQKDRGEAPAGPVILVENTLDALQLLAHEYRKQLNVRVIGVTGSNGKTSTKDMIAAILTTTYRVHKTQGNFNNHIGLPLTLLQLEENTEMAVIEMGMSGRGEISLLSKLAEPEVVLITNIGEAHLEQLGSRDEIAKAKLEILHGLRGDGLFIYPGEEPLIAQYLPEAEKPESMLRLTYGETGENDFYPCAILQDGEGSYFALNNSPRTTYYLPVLGRHNIVNAIGAIAAAKYMGVSEAQIVRGLRELRLTGMRIERQKGVSGITVLNDSYNASPTSMKAALQLLHDLRGFRNKIAVLGDMLELGPNAEEYHREIGKYIDPRQVHAVYAYGPLSKQIITGASEVLPKDRVFWFETKKELCDALLPELRPEDAVLVKASRGMKMEEIVERLLKAYL
ncbi:UDP-N-acetylmuramoyl-tripeptide--D-alanyl-D-alanine ligase [Paenibacillus turpanensis]|uniref:UDP-N-acetylmuramoyl-tripeptide--D-alanyl-D- alanine ligase n=1 Tax=Paenibacillus turpanensis TaxID=2689078 RepID=UPI001408CC5B|nr:UDP-N-acetylmuramoyl-tripeptide--D-alanyl-D-alanine ligase [Paenibacillus turpanensis]